MISLLPLQFELDIEPRLKPSLSAGVPGLNDTQDLSFSQAPSKGMQPLKETVSEIEMLTRAGKAPHIYLFHPGAVDIPLHSSSSSSATSCPPSSLASLHPLLAVMPPPCRSLFLYNSPFTYSLTPSWNWYARHRPVLAALETVLVANVRLQEGGILGS